jgi:branched-chain amino acid transport system substrate-binding protein
LFAKSGGGADWGKKMEIAAEIAIKEINEKGGVNDCKLELISKDTGTDYQRAVILTRELAVERKVPVIYGPSMSGEQEVCFPWASILKIPICSGSGAKEGIAARNRPWTFKITGTDAGMLEPAIDKFIEKYKVKKVAIIQDTKDGWSVAMTKVLPPLFKKKGIEIVTEKDPISWETGAIDFSAQVTKLKHLKPDGIGVAAIYGEVASFAREMKRQRINIFGVDSSGIFASEFIAQGGDAVEGWIVAATFWAENPDPKCKAFVSKFVETAKKITPASPDPTWADANTYDLFYILSDIFRSAGITGDTELEVARERIKGGLEKVKNFKGVSGVSSIGSDGEGIKQPYVLIIEGRKFTLLKE